MIAAVKPMINRYRKAITVTAAHADRMEEANTPEAIVEAKKISIAEQAAAGVAALIEKNRV